MITETSARPRVVSADEWRAERLRLLEHEKEATKHRDRVNAERRRMPMVKLDKAYSFEGPDGQTNLAGLFDGKKQLIVYHFMFEPDGDEGCPGCTGYVDAIGDLSALDKRDARFVIISRAPLEKLEAYKKKHGWDLPWYSSIGSDFNYDFHVTLDEKVAPIEYNYRKKEDLENSETGSSFQYGEEHGLSVFFRENDTVYHTYSAYARGTEGLTESYYLLDVTPFGRQEDWEDSPEGWPQKPTYG